jgi:hypothetical protein
MGLVADPDRDLAVQHIERLVEVGVDVKRGTGKPGGDDLLNESGATVGVLAAEADADRASEQEIAGG